MVVPGEAVNSTVEAFAINSWAEVEYNDPSYQKFDFHIAEDLIYDVNNDTFAVATPFDVRNGQKETSGVSTVGQGSSAQTGPGNGTASAAADTGTTYNIGFTFLTNPLARRSTQQAPAAQGPTQEAAAATQQAAAVQPTQAFAQAAAHPAQAAAMIPAQQAAAAQAAARPIQAAAQPAQAAGNATAAQPVQAAKNATAAQPVVAAAQATQPSGGVERITSGQLDDSQVGGKAFAAFADLVARLYFNVATAALGNACNPGCASPPPARHAVSRPLW